MLIHEKSVTLLFILFCGRFGLIADLTGQTLILPVILTGQTLILPVTFLDSNIFFCCIALKPSKKKNAAIN